VRLALEAAGFALQEAADAEQGLMLARSSTPDCILLDYGLPDAEGLQVLESLRGPGGTLPCAVVMADRGRNGGCCNCRDEGWCARLPRQGPPRCARSAAPRGSSG
jgi:DNA-binding NarL/FixJ family response regulator